MSRFTRVILLAFFMVPSVSSSQEHKLSPSAFGPVHIGMSPDEAGGRLGTLLKKVDATYQDARYVVIPAAHNAGVSFTVSAEGVIDGIYLGHDAGLFKTDHGLHIGSSANDIWRKHSGKIDVKAYQCASAFLIYTFRLPEDPSIGITYTVSDSGLVEGIMAGNLVNVTPPC